MTADSNHALADQLTKVAAAIAAFPTTTPEIRSVVVNTNKYQPYDARLNLPARGIREGRLQDPRDLARIAAAFHAAVHIRKKSYSSSREVAVDFRFSEVQFYIECDITSPDARAVAKFLKRKLPTNEDALEITAAELARALTTLESA